MRSEPNSSLSRQPPLVLVPAIAATYSAAVRGVRRSCLKRHHPLSEDNRLILIELGAELTSQLMSEADRYKSAYAGRADAVALALDKEECVLRGPAAFEHEVADNYRWRQGYTTWCVSRVTLIRYRPAVDLDIPLQCTRTVPPLFSALSMKSLH